MVEFAELIETEKKLETLAQSPTPTTPLSTPGRPIIKMGNDV